MLVYRRVTPPPPVVCRRYPIVSLGEERQSGAEFLVRKQCLNPRPQPHTPPQKCIGIYSYKVKKELALQYPPSMLDNIFRGMLARMMLANDRGIHTVPFMYLHHMRDIANPLVSVVQSAGARLDLSCGIRCNFLWDGFGNWISSHQRTPIWKPFIATDGKLVKGGQSTMMSTRWMILCVQKDDLLCVITMQ